MSEARIYVDVIHGFDPCKNKSDIRYNTDCPFHDGHVESGDYACNYVPGCDCPMCEDNGAEYD